MKLSGDDHVFAFSKIREYCQVNWNDSVKRFIVCFNVIRMCCTA